MQWRCGLGDICSKSSYDRSSMPRAVWKLRCPLHMFLGQFGDDVQCLQFMLQMGLPSALKLHSISSVPQAALQYSLLFMGTHFASAHVAQLCGVTTHFKPSSQATSPHKGRTDGQLMQVSEQTARPAKVAWQRCLSIRYTS